MRELHARPPGQFPGGKELDTCPRKGGDAGACSKEQLRGRPGRGGLGALCTRQRVCSDEPRSLFLNHIRLKRPLAPMHGSTSAAPEDIGGHHRGRPEPSGKGPPTERGKRPRADDADRQQRHLSPALHKAQWPKLPQSRGGRRVQEWTRSLHTRTFSRSRKRPGENPGQGDGLTPPRQEAPRTARDRSRAGKEQEARPGAGADDVVPGRPAPTAASNRLGPSPRTAGATHRSRDHATSHR